MNRMTITILCLALIGVAVNSFSADPTNPGPEIVKFKMGGLVLPFKHWNHQKSLNNKCSPCHATEIGTITGWNKETAHSLCISCHETMGKGPTECKACHDVHYSQNTP